MRIFVSQKDTSLLFYFEDIEDILPYLTEDHFRNTIIKNKCFNNQIPKDFCDMIATEEFLWKILKGNPQSITSFPYEKQTRDMWRYAVDNTTILYESIPEKFQDIKTYNPLDDKPDFKEYLEKLEKCIDEIHLKHQNERENKYEK